MSKPDINTAELIRIQKEIRDLEIERDMETNRIYYRKLCEYIHHFEDIIEQANPYKVDIEGVIGSEYIDFAKYVLKILGRQPEPCFTSLKDYDHNSYGPFFGVSDEGSAADYIRHAALDSPKAAALKDSLSPMKLGVACDAERLAAIGEVAVGPEEYINIRLKSMRSILTTTNVGTRLNIRYFKTRPVVSLVLGAAFKEGLLSNSSIEYAKNDVISQLDEVVAPYIFTPDKKPRPVTILISFGNIDSMEFKVKVLKGIQEHIQNRSNIDNEIHKIALVEHLNTKKTADDQVNQLFGAIDTASATGIMEVAIEGRAREDATSSISLPGLLNFLEEDHLQEVLDYALHKGVSLRPKDLVDTNTVARNVWMGLHSAYLMGLELGKYGLSPLTLSESLEVMKQIQEWFKDWTAAPALYIDHSLVSENCIYHLENRLIEGMKLWLDGVAQAGVPVVLIDTADKSKGYRLFDKEKNGILTLQDVKQLNAYASKSDTRVLWAGGISLSQIYEIGKIRPFGIYVTSATAIQKPVSEYYSDEPMAVEKEPGYVGILSAKIILEAGFLKSSMDDLGHSHESENIENAVKGFIEKCGGFSNKQEILNQELYQLLVDAWLVHINSK